jgi:hypothetical protein
VTLSGERWSRALLCRKRAQAPRRLVVRRKVGGILALPENPHAAERSEPGAELRTLVVRFSTNECREGQRRNHVTEIGAASGELITQSPFLLAELLGERQVPRHFAHDASVCGLGRSANLLGRSDAGGVLPALDDLKSGIRRRQRALGLAEFCPQVSQVRAGVRAASEGFRSPNEFRVEGPAGEKRPQIIHPRLLPIAQLTKFATPRVLGHIAGELFNQRAFVALLGAEIAADPIQDLHVQTSSFE